MKTYTKPEVEVIFFVSEAVTGDSDISINIGYDPTYTWPPLPDEELWN